MKYIVVRANDVDYLCQEVNVLLCGGWKLQGGVSIATLHSTTVYVQALYKEQ